MPKAPTRVRRTFTPQFKRDAVRLVVTEGKSVTEVATHLGITRSLLQRWKEQLAMARQEAFPGHGRLPKAAQRVRELEQHLRVVTQERDISKKSLGVLRDRPEVRFHFMAQHFTAFPVGRMCAVLGVSRSGFYAWRRRPPSARAQRTAEVLAAIHAAHQTSREVYGAPRVYQALRRIGLVVGRHRVARLMREAGLRGRAAQRFRYIATRHREGPAPPNRLQQQFHSPAPDRIWCADITQVRTREGWLFLAVLLDLCSRRIVGWATAAQPTQTLALTALTAALRSRRPAPGLLHHSDRGGPYASAEYQTRLDRHGLVASMSRPGNCFDNAPVESFFHLLKTEWLYHHTFHSRSQAHSAIFEYIEGFYTRTRLHSGLGYRSPLEYETRTITR